MKIRSELDRSSGIRSKSSDSGSKANKIENTNTNDNAPKSNEDKELDRIARTWYKEAPAHSFKEVSGIGDANGFGLEWIFRGQCRWGKYKGTKK